MLQTSPFLPRVLEVLIDQNMIMLFVLASLRRKCSPLSLFDEKSHKYRKASTYFFLILYTSETVKVLTSFDLLMN